MSDLAYQTEEAQLTPDTCPAGTVIVNTQGAGSLLRVEKWDGNIVDIAAWEGTDLTVLGGEPAQEYPGRGDLHGVSVQKVVMPEATEEQEPPAANEEPLTLQSILAKNQIGTVEIVEEEAEPTEEPEPEEDVPEEEEPEAVESESEEAESDVGPPTGAYEGWEEAKKAWVYIQVYEAEGVMGLTELTIRAQKEQWPKLSPDRIEEKIFDRVAELQDDGYEIAIYDDSMVAIGDYDGTKLESVEDLDSESREEPTPEPEEPEEIEAPPPSPAEAVVEADFQGISWGTVVSPHAHLSRALAGILRDHSATLRETIKLLGEQAAMGENVAVALEAYADDIEDAD